jgi:hypothetical protein
LSAEPARAPAPEIALDVRENWSWRFLESLDPERAGDRELLTLTRGDEIEVVSNLVLAAKASILYAFSGNGKTSLIDAGVIPHMHKAGFAVFKTRPRPASALAGPAEAFKEGILRNAWLPLTSRGDREMIARAKASLAELPPSAAKFVEPLLQRAASLMRNHASLREAREQFRELLEPLRARPLPEFVGAVQEYLGAEVSLLFVLDQFEELFVHYYNTAPMLEFVNDLGTIAADGKIRARFLFSMREDWVGSMVVFRHAIPDLLTSIHRLEPIRVSQSKPAITYPLERVGVGTEPGLAERILEDLSAFYDVLQKQSFLAVHLAPSEEGDAYVELPAIQIVMESLWRRVGGTASRVTIADYESLAPGSANPAATVLEGYLEWYLNDASELDDTNDRERLKELRIDLLYLLTDQFAHRRASSRRTLIEELKRLYAQPVSPKGAGFAEADLDKALRPLLNRGLVRCAEGLSGGSEYELAHDFAVRSVVATWKTLDRKRIEEQAVLTQSQRHREARLEALERSERRGVWAIRALAVIAIVALAFSSLPGLSVSDAQGAAVFCLFPVSFLALVSIVLWSKPGFVFAFAAAGSAGLILLSATSESWPSSWDLLIAQSVSALSLLLCTVWALTTPRTEPADDWTAKLPAECGDYALSLFCGFIAFAVLDRFFPGALTYGSGWYEVPLDFAAAVGLWFGIQLIAVLGGGATLGYKWLGFGFEGPLSGSVLRTAKQSFCHMILIGGCWSLVLSVRGSSSAAAYLLIQLLAIGLFALYQSRSEGGEPFWASGVKAVRMAGVTRERRTMWGGILRYLFR